MRVNWRRQAEDVCILGGRSSSVSRASPGLYLVIGGLSQITKVAVDGGRTTGSASHASNSSAKTIQNFF